jgi:hypothetical protein
MFLRQQAAGILACDSFAVRRALREGSTPGPGAAAVAAGRGGFGNLTRHGITMVDTSPLLAGATSVALLALGADWLAGDVETRWMVHWDMLRPLAGFAVVCRSAYPVADCS